MQDISRSDVCEQYHYDPETGHFTRIKSVRGFHAGTRVGTISIGYLHIGVKRKIYLAHRLAWLYMTGEWPPEEIDHINRNGLDNRWCNLRLATSQQNKMNRRVRRDSATGIKGVQLSFGKYQASIIVNGQRIPLGRHKQLEDAKEAYAEAARKYFGDYARTD